MASPDSNFERQQAQTGLTRLLGFVQPKGVYRPDIDGLRALAILAVAAYHYARSFFPGGFIGVDVFFVISGYLITGILLKDNADGSYSVARFYQHRIRRIFPAMLVVLVVCSLAGWLVLFPFEYQRLGKHIAAAAVFIENFTLWREAGYFDFGALEKPLLHFWSLAVEEQFYLVWPLLLWLALRLQWNLKWVVALILAASFALNLGLVATNHASSSFYLPFTRAWELMAGAALAIAHRSRSDTTQRLREVLPLLGLLLIALGFLWIRPQHAFPGAWALLPVLGTVLLVHAGPSAWINRRIFSWRPMVWIGLISYPLYLWHWALLSLAYIILGPVPHGDLRRAGTLAIISVLLAWLTYRWVEQPIRRNGGNRSAVALAGGVALLGVFGFVVCATGGLPSRPFSLYSPAAAGYLQSIRSSPLREACHDLFQGEGWPARWSCTLGDTKAVAWVGAIGDSHAMSMIPALDAWGRAAHMRIVFASQDSCLALLDTYRITFGRYGGVNCMIMTQQMAQVAQQTPPQAMLLVQDWPIHFHGAESVDSGRTVVTAHLRQGKLEKTNTIGKPALVNGLAATLAYYRALQVPVVLFSDSPRQGAKLASELALIRFAKHPTDLSFNAHAQSLAEHRNQEQATNQLLRDAVAKDPSASILDVDPALCNSNICPLVENGRFLYTDDAAHLSIIGSMLVYPLISAHMRKVLAHHAPHQTNQASEPQKPPPPRSALSG